MTSTSTPHDELASTDLVLERSVARLVDDARDARAATAVFSGSASGAEQRYADEVAATLSTMEFDLRTAKAALRARLADSTEDLHGTITDVEDAARTWLDDLSLQARLGTMEMRDRAEFVTRRLDRAGAETRRAASRVSDAVEADLDEMRRITLHSIGDVRTALTDAVEALRKLDD
jgi:ATP-dependent Zn protease